MARLVGIGAGGPLALLVAFAVFVGQPGCSEREARPPTIATSSVAQSDGDRLERGSEAPFVASDKGELARAGPWSEEFPSLIQILAHPDDYHGKTVVVEGFLRVEFEGDALYLSEGDDRYLITSNAFWVSFENNAMRMNRDEIGKQFNGKWVLLEARFDKDHRGHLGLFEGAFENIARLSVKQDREQMHKELKSRGFGMTNKHVWRSHYCRRWESAILPAGVSACGEDAAWPSWLCCHASSQRCRDK